MHSNTSELDEARKQISRAFDFGYSAALFYWHGHRFQLRHIEGNSHRYRNLYSKRDLQRVILEALHTPGKRTVFQTYTGVTFELKRVGAQIVYNNVA